MRRRADTEPVDSGKFGINGVRNPWYNFPESPGREIDSSIFRHEEPEHHHLLGLHLDGFDLQMAIRHKRQLRVAPLLAGTFVPRRTSKSIMGLVFAFVGFHWQVALSREFRLDTLLRLRDHIRRVSESAGNLHFLGTFSV